MNKFYKLKKDLPTFTAGDIFELRADGCLWQVERYEGENHWKDEVMAYHRRTLEHFPNILRDWFEETEVPADFAKKPAKDFNKKTAYQFRLLHKDSVIARIQKHIGFIVIQSESSEDALQIAGDALSYDYFVDASSSQKCFIANRGQEVE